MAKDKKSFIAYCEWLETFEELEDEEAGRLAKHLFRYVNDLNPTTDDKTVKLCFISIKQSLKRDLKKYDVYIEKQKGNGAKGGRPKKTQITQAFISKPKKADSVNDNDIHKYTPPTLEEFLTYCVNDIAKDRSEYLSKKDSAILKYKSWAVDDWHKTVNGKRSKIKNWKTTILNTWKFL